MEVLLNDASALLNLLAIASSASQKRPVGNSRFCPAVRDEVKKLRDVATGEMVPIDIAPLMESGLLRVLELAGETELALYVEQAVGVDDGEAMSIAIAANRQLALAIDDKQAANHARRKFPDLRLWSTPEILKHWAEAGKIEARIRREAILRIEGRARYFPHDLNPLAAWWRKMKELEEPPKT